MVNKLRQWASWLVLICAVSTVIAAEPATCQAPEPLPPAAVKCEADTETCAAWQRFRRERPYPYQAISVAKREATGGYTVIVSEPPPVGSNAEVRALIHAALGTTQSSRLRYPQGLDGWFEDIVVEVRAAGAMQAVPTAGGQPAQLPADLVRRLRFLDAALFGTAEAFHVNIADQAAATPVRAANLKVSAGDLLGILDAKRPHWRSVSGGEKVQSFQQLTVEHVSGVYIDEANTTVGLHIPPRTSLPSLQGMFRKFAVAGDHLIGAVHTRQGGLLLVARTRVVPLRDLPPMRFETLQSLVSSAGKNLGQSYERQRVFAGKIGAGEYASWDWAPIYLTPQLQDTEFGALLNIADQQLKSWSECAQVAYASFDYPPPASFPFGDTPASTWVSERSLNDSLIFNWNTRGFATVMDGSVGRVVTAYSTGALPVSYIVPESGAITMLSKLLGVKANVEEDASLKASQRGSQYFAGLGDPILARVVQNVLLFQVVSETRAFAKPPAATTATNRYDRVGKVLVTKAHAWLKAVLEGKADDPGLAKNLRRAMVAEGVTQSQLVDALATPEKQGQQILQTVKQMELARMAMRALAARAKPIEDEYVEVTGKYNAAWEPHCQSLGGSIRRDKDGSHVVCKVLSRSSVSTKFPYEDRIEQLRNQLEPLQKEAKSLATHHEADAEALDRLVAQREAADELAEKIRGIATYKVELDDVLQDVLRAAGTSESAGSIRTPAVVLSRNRAQAMSVGGHNIDSLPWKVSTNSAKGAPRLIGAGTERPTLQVSAASAGDTAVAARSLVTGDQATTRPAREARVALELESPQQDSFLAALRSHEPLKADAAMRQRAQECNCDFYVESLGEGTAHMIKLKPPPAERTVLGDPALIEALRAARPKDRVVFANYSRERSRALGETLPRAEGYTEGRRLSDWIEMASHLFTAGSERLQKVVQWKSAGGRNVTVVVPEALASKNVMQQQLPWRQATASKAVRPGHPADTVVAITLPQAGDVHSIDVAVFARQGRDVAVVAERATRQSLSQMPRYATLEESASRLVDGLFRSNPETTAVDVYLNGISAVTVLRFERGAELALAHPAP